MKLQSIGWACAIVCGAMFISQARAETPATQPAAVVPPAGIPAEVIPATGPSTQPAVALDQTTPRGTLKLLSKAQISGDGSQLSQLVFTENDEQKKFLEAVAQTMTANGRLETSVTTKFPLPGADPVLRNARRDEQIQRTHEEIDKLEEKIDGDIASLTRSGLDTEKMTLKRVDGKWYVPFALIYKEHGDLAQQTKVLQMIATMYNGLSADVDSGKLASLADVQQAVRTRGQEMETAARALETTQPSTGPSTAPPWSDPQLRRRPSPEVKKNVGVQK